MGDEKQTVKSANVQTGHVEASRSTLECQKGVFSSFRPESESATRNVLFSRLNRLSDSVPLGCKIENEIICGLLTTIHNIFHYNVFFHGLCGGPLKTAQLVHF